MKPNDAMRRAINWYLAVGLVSNFIFLSSVIECYFSTTKVSGLQHFGTESAGAKRVILFVADGLRADLLFNVNPFPNIPGAPNISAPYLRSIAQSKGAFGISHTRVPTESRPGHVALLSGVYEDLTPYTLSNVKPIEVDSIINQSSHSFAFGAHDIVSLFAGGPAAKKIDIWSFSEQNEDYTRDSSVLDLWVLEQLQALFHNATQDAALRSRLQADKTVIFLHLLGLDMTGHSYRPLSKEYMSSIQLVDSIVEAVERTALQFFSDDKTAFIFTSDHGMLPKGNHGDGDPQNTRTPLIAWGAGVRGPTQDSVPSSHDNYSSGWGLTHLYRQDLKQADVAALITTLLGSYWPTDSVGVLPDVDPTQVGFLQPIRGEKDQAMASLVNAKVLMEHFQVKQELKQSKTLVYTPFPLLPAPQNVSVAHIETMIQEGDFRRARSTAASIISHALNGIRYIDSYDRVLKRAVVFLAFSGRTTLGLLHIQSPSSSNSAGTKQLLHTSSLPFIGLIIGVLAVQGMPSRVYLYAAFAIYFWCRAAIRLPTLRRMAYNGNPIRVGLARDVCDICMMFALCALTSIAYTYRTLWGLGYFILGIAWPLIHCPRTMLSENRVLATSWALACSTSAIFPLLPAYQEENLNTIIWGAMCLIIAGALLTSSLYRSNAVDKRSSLVFSYQILLMVLGLMFTISATKSLQNKMGLPPRVILAGRCILSLATVTPFLCRILLPIKHSEISFFLGFAPWFIMLSLSFEGFAYLSYSVTLCLWSKVEVVRRSYNERERQEKRHLVQKGDVRVSASLLFLAQAGYFGMGNVASTVSFYLEPNFRLVPEFNPTLLMVLVVVKIIAPYFVLSTSLAFLAHHGNISLHRILLLVSLQADVIIIGFFLTIPRNESWKDIFEGVCSFWISSLLSAWTGAVCAVGPWLLGLRIQRMETKHEYIAM